MPRKIKQISAEEILDSRGRPTINVTVRTESSAGSFAVPSGASTGANEAHELRDGDPEHFSGMGVDKAIGNIKSIIAPALLGMDVSKQELIDKKLIELDGTKNKSRLGANAIIGVSIAVVKAAAASVGREPYQYLRSLADMRPSRKVPFLFMNLINGGKHAKSRLAFQEYHIIPQTDNVENALDIGTRVQIELAEILVRRLGPTSANTGDEDGFVPDTDSIIKPLEFLQEAVQKLGFEDVVRFGLDVAASSFYQGGHYKIEGKKYDTDGLKDLYFDLITKFSLFSIEDPFQEEDYRGFSRLRANYPDMLTIGDDLTVTNKHMLEEAIKRNSINAIIIKPNQVGTLTETLATMKLARDNNIECIVSHRSGETHDTFIADLAYAFACYGLKTGAPRGGERVAKYNRLLHITREDPKKFSWAPISQEKQKHSRAQIVATIGPATKNKDIIRRMVDHQMDVARLNFAWGTYAEHEHYIKTVRNAAKEMGRKIPILMDLPGPRVQTKKGHHYDESAHSLLSQKDLEHLSFGIEQGVDYVVMSYVGSGRDIERLKEKIREFGAGIPVIAKVERQKALDNIDSIIAAADAVMIGRGDLANDIPLEEIPFAQREIIERAKAAGKPVIVATQMLLSMVENAEPTRAEVTDVSQAILQGADAVMLSEETAKGKYPIEVVKVMERIVKEAEEHKKETQINQL